MAADAKQLEEDERTGARRYVYIRTGEDHFSLAFTYALLAVVNPPGKMMAMTIGGRAWRDKRGLPVDDRW